jgi:hypothetical protein
VVKAFAAGDLAERLKRREEKERKRGSGRKTDKSEGE